MIKRIAQAVTVAAVAAPVSALAANAEGAHGTNWTPLFWMCVNFLLYAAIIRSVYVKRGAPALRARKAQIEQHVNRSAHELLGIESELSRVRERLERFQAERPDFLREFEDEGRELAAQARESGVAEATRIQRSIKEQIESEFAQVHKEVRKELVQRATKLAKEELSQGLPSEKNRQLWQSVIRAVS